MTDLIHWYRNGRRGKYHAERSDWTRSGKAMCGGSIKNPGYTKSLRTFLDRDLCSHCVHVLSSGKATP